MKKIILLVILFLFKIEVSNAGADFEILKNNLNHFTNKGYKIIFVNGMEKENYFYTLEKDNDVVVCRLIFKAKKTFCYRP